jgi:hypothetical protein
MQNYLARLFISKNTGTGECGQLALEVPNNVFRSRFKGTFRCAGMHL